MEGDEDLEQLHRKVLDALRVPLTVVPLLVLVFASLEIASGASSTWLFIHQASSLVVAGVLWWRSGPLSTRRWMLCAAVTVSAGCTLFHYGPLFGTGAFFVTVTLAASFFLGRRGTLAAVAALLLFFVVATWGARSGWLVPKYAPPNLTAWIRLSVGAAFLLAACGILFDRVQRFSVAALRAEAIARKELIERDEDRARFMLGIDRSNDAIFMTARDGTIHYVNTAFEKLYGFTSAEAIGKTPRILKSGEYEEDRYQRLWETLLAKRVVTTEMVNKTKDGRRVEVESSANPILDERGEIVGFLAIQRDITERNRTVAERQRMQAQLVQSQKMEAVGRLAGGVAHDFNNLMSVVLSFSDLLLSELRPEDPMRADLEEIKQAGERASSLTRQLLAFSRKQVLAPQPVNLNDVIAPMHKMLRRLIGEDVELVTTPGPDLGTVIVDPGQVEQVVMNLAVNARDAMPEGGRLTIETSNVLLDEQHAREHPGSKPGPHVMLVVADTGTGMAPATVARIFEPFFTTKEVGKGSGLGLSTVLGIIEQSGGSITVESELGKGTTFKIYFQRTDARPRASAAAPTTDRLRGSERIVLVEDDAAVRAAARAALESMGYHVTEAASPSEAIQACERDESIALLITDVVMPEMSGPEVARRAVGARPQLKVLCMSGYIDDAILHRGLGAGMAFLQKPFTRESLARKVREVLDG